MGDHFTSERCSFSRFAQRVSDLQFVLYHVEGVVREVHLLDAVDDLLLRLGVDGLLPQLPQLLLKERPRERDTAAKRGGRELEDVLDVKHFKKFQTHWDTNRKGPEQRITSCPK